MANYGHKVFRKVNKTKERRRKNREFRDNIDDFLSSENGRKNFMLSALDGKTVSSEAD